MAKDVGVPDVGAAERDALRILDEAVDRAVYEVSKCEVALRQARVAERKARQARAERQW